MKENDVRVTKDDNGLFHVEIVAKQHRGYGANSLGNAYLEWSEYGTPFSNLDDALSCAKTLIAKMEYEAKSKRRIQVWPV